MRFWRQAESGTTAIEFALVFPVLLLLVTLTLEIGYYFFTATVLESAVTRATYGTLMGRDGAGKVRLAVKKQVLTMDNARLLKADRLHIGLDVQGTSDSMYKRHQRIHNPLEPEEPILVDANLLAVTGAASSAEILRLKVSYGWQPLLPFTTGLLGWLPPLETLALMRYEPI